MSQTNTPVILVADDEIDIRTMLRLLLERDGYIVEEARNGEEAVAVCRRRMPDIVLMDILMPIMDGAAACSYIQAMPGGDQVPVLMVTALNDRQSIDRCFDAGATDYITKPINNQVLRRRLARLLRTQQAEAELRASEARLASIIATATDAILLTNADGRIRLFNPAAERIFGYSAAEITDQPIDLLLSGQLLKDCFEQWNQPAGHQSPAGEYLQCRGRRRDGTEFPVEAALGQFEQDQTTMLTVTLRDITRRKQAEAEVERRAQQLASLAQMGQAVTTRLEQDEVLKTVIDQVMLRLQAEGVSVLLREGASELVFAAVNGASADRLRGVRLPLEAGIAGEVVRTGHAVRVRSADDRSRIYRDIEQVSKYHTQDLVAVPLKLGSEVLGVMEAVHSQTFVFNDDDLRLLESAASWAAIAIGNARQHQRLQRRLRESEAMAAIGRALNGTLDLDQVLQLIVTSARQMIPQAHTAALLLIGEIRDIAYAATQHGRAESQWHAHSFGRTLDQGQVVNIGDLRQVAEPGFIEVEPGMRSFLAAPVRFSVVSFGAITVQCSEAQAFDADDERLLAMLGDEAAIAIENARLYQSEHTQRELAEALRDTAATITGSLDLDDVLDRILDNVGRVVPHDAANIMLAESGIARLARWRGYDHAAGDQLRARRFSIADTLPLRQMSESHLPLVVVDTREFAGWVTLPGSRAVQSFIGAPIRFKRQLLGFINLESVTAGFFGQAYADRLQVSADQAAVAIENARLYQLEQEQFQRWQQSQAAALQTDKMEALRRLASSVTSAIEHPLQRMQDDVQMAMNAERDPEQRAVDLQNASNEIERLTQITHSISSFAQPAPELRRAVSLVELIQQSLSLARASLEQHRIQLTTDLQAAPDVLAAPQQMTQALFYLIENAVEAAQARGQIHIATQADGEFVAVMIIDDGPAISPAVMPHIFEPFYTTKPNRAGLGLTISHNVIQQQGGTLTASNVSNERGVMFTAKLPLV